MSLSEISGIIAGVIFSVSASWYVIDVAKKRATPSIATFLMFIFINISQLSSILAEEVWSVLPFTFVGTAASVSVFFLSLRSGKFYLSFADKIGFVGAFLGFLLWLATDSAALNLYVITTVNLITFTPLIIKVFKHPELETKIPWQLNLLASLFLLLTINSAAAVVWIVPARQFLCSLLLNIGLLRSRTS